MGPETERLVRELLGCRSQQEQNFRAILGILGLVDRFGAARLEVASRLALSLGPRARNYPTVASILQKNETSFLNPPPVHHKSCMINFGSEIIMPPNPITQSTIPHHSTLDQLEKLRFYRMARALRDQLAQPDINRLSFLERLTFLLDCEASDREHSALNLRLRRAKLHQIACMEDIDYQTPSGFNRQQMLQLANCDWIRCQQNVILTGPTGTGKSYLACALARKACPEGFNACYHRLPRLPEELSIARVDGQYLNVLNKLKKLDVLVLDDWGHSPLTQTQQEDLSQILDDRIQNRSTIATGRLPFEHWHQSMANPTFADAILDRLVQPAYRVELSGESMRKQQSNP